MSWWNRISHATWDACRSQQIMKQRNKLPLPPNFLPFPHDPPLLEHHKISMHKRKRGTQDEKKLPLNAILHIQWQPQLLNTSSTITQSHSNFCANLKHQNGNPNRRWLWTTNLTELCLWFTIIFTICTTNLRIDSDSTNNEIYSKFCEMV